MKYALSIAALAAVAVAQLPSCSEDCIRDAVAAESDCTFGDWECLCVPAVREAVTLAGTPCVVEACGLDTALNEVVPAIAETCANPGSGGGDDEEEEEEETTPPPTDDDEEEEETTPPPTESAPPTESDDAYPPPEEEEESYVPPPVPSPTNNGTIPEPSHEEAAGAGKVGFMGAAAMLGLAALAL